MTEAIYEAGYQSSSSAYGQSTGQLGMTPAAYRRGGQDTTITYTITPCPLGYLLVAATPQGICAVRLGDSEAALTATLVDEFSAATLQRSDDALLPWVSTMQDYLHGGHPQMDLPLDIRATAFQQRVWTALQQIPYGSTRSYSEVAEAIGQPTAVRAAARACATNPVALVIPCHRVVREDGSLGGYRWGIERKEALLAKKPKAKLMFWRNQEFRTPSFASKPPFQQNMSSVSRCAASATTSTLSTRRPSMSTTSKRKPCQSKLCPAAGTPRTSAMIKPPRVW